MIAKELERRALSAFGIVLGLVLLASHGYAFHKGWAARGDRAAIEQETALTRQAAGLQAQCSAEKRITQEVSHDYQDKIAGLRRQLADLKRVRPSMCVTVTGADAATGRDAAAGGGQPAGPDGVRSEFLYDFAAEAEEYRLRLIACQDFVRRAATP